MSVWILARVCVSILCGGIFYFLWMGAFLLASGWGGFIVEAVLWLLAPVVTASGFAGGILLFDRWRHRTKARFFSVFVWPFVGCAIGAGVVWPFGPMLIVFGMLAAGTASVVVREAFLLSREG